MLFRSIFETTYDEITYYLVDNEFYFAGNAPYNNIYEDVEKFAFFSKAVLEALPYLDFCPDIIHCHDWQTGLLPVFLRTLYGDEEYYTGIKTVFSIHNLKFQGRWKLPAVMDITGLHRTHPPKRNRSPQQTRFDSPADLFVCRSEEHTSELQSPNLSRMPSSA